MTENTDSRLNADDIFPSGNGAFREFFDRSAIRAARLDRKLRFVETNADFAAEFASPEPPPLTGQPLAELLHPCVRGHIVHQLTRLVEGQRTRFAERVLALRPDGSVFGGELTGFVISGEAGTLDGLMVLLRPEQCDSTAVAARHDIQLSPVHARVLEGIAAGASTAQLAGRLHLSRGGIEYHVGALLRTMKVSSRSALVAKAHAMGLLCTGTWPPRVPPDYVR